MTRVEQIAKEYFDNLSTTHFIDDNGDNEGYTLRVLHYEDFLIILEELSRRSGLFQEIEDGN